MWEAIGYAAITAHYAFLAYLLVGGFIAARFRWTIVTYLATVIWAVLIVTTHVPCPLTALQNHAREAAGMARLPDSFINLYVQGTFYPHGQELAAQAVVAVLVLTSLVVFWRRWTARRAPTPVSPTETAVDSTSRSS